MGNGFIHKQIDRSNRNMLISNLLLMAFPVSIGIFGISYWSNFFSGPATTSATEIASIKKGQLPDRNYIAVKGDKTIKTGMKEITTTRRRGIKTGEKVSAKFVALKLDKKLLIVKTKPGAIGNTEFTGELKPIPQDVRGRLITPLLKKYPKAKNMFVPFMLDHKSDYKGIGYVGLLLGVPCAALAAWNLTKVKQRWGKLNGHPIAKNLSKDSEDVTLVAEKIDQEMANGHRIGKTTITRNWLFRPKTYGLDSLRLEELVWFYQKVTTHRTNGIPTGKTYATVIHDRAGRSFELAAKEDQVQQVMQILYDKAPWAVTGYNDDLKKMWAKERDQLIAAVDQRRQAA